MVVGGFCVVFAGNRISFRMFCISQVIGWEDSLRSDHLYSTALQTGVAGGVESLVGRVNSITKCSSRLRPTAAGAG